MRPPLQQAAKALVRKYAPTKLYPRPVSALGPEKLYAYLDAVWKRRELDGALVEVGCWLGGTAALTYRMLRNTGFEKRYVCIDTFSGFVPEHFARDTEHGTARRRGLDFAGNSRETVARLLRHYGCEAIELVEGDIATLPDEALPGAISVALVDVDLEVPVYEALARVYPRLVAGGVVLVDDCREGHSWPGARVAYTRFVRERGLPERYFMGMGIVENTAFAQREASERAVESAIA